MAVWPCRVCECGVVVHGSVALSCMGMWPCHVWQCGLVMYGSVAMWLHSGTAMLWDAPLTEKAPFLSCIAGPFVPSEQHCWALQSCLPLVWAAIH